MIWHHFGIYQQYILLHGSLPLLYIQLISTENNLTQKAEKIFRFFSGLLFFFLLLHSILLCQVVNSWVWRAYKQFSFLFPFFFSLSPHHFIQCLFDKRNRKTKLIVLHTFNCLKSMYGICCMDSPSNRLITSGLYWIGIWYVSHVLRNNWWAIKTLSFPEKCILNRLAFWLIAAQPKISRNVI